jgi:hypothetical protein
MPVSDSGVGATVGAELAQQVALVNQQAVQIESSAKSFAAAAGSGFHIEPEAAATLIKACTDSIHELNALQAEIWTVSQAPKLGTTPGARVIAPFTQQVATDPQGMAPAIQSLIRTLTDMVQAYRKASTNYAETEAIIQASLPKPPPA